MNRLLLLLFITVSCAVKEPKGEIKTLKGTVDKIEGKRAIFVNNIKICNYFGNKKQGDSIEINYIETKYQNEYINK